MTNLKKLIGIVSFLISIVIGFIALYMPPVGIIDNSVLWFIAQLLVFTANLFGFSNVFEANKDVQSDKCD